MAREDEIVTEIKRATTELRATLESQIEKRTAGISDRIEIIDRINQDITSMRQDLTAMQQRAALSIQGIKEDSPESALQKRAFIKYLRAGESSTFTPEERRALSSLSDADGGFLVPTDFESSIIVESANMAEIRSVVSARPTGRDTVFMPSISKPIVTWGNVGIALTPDELAAGGETLTIHDCKSLALIHNNTLDDAVSDIWAELSQPFADAIAESEDMKFAAGSGVDEPLGIVTDKRVQARFSKSGVAATLTDSTHNGVDALISALYALKKTYRRRATWAFNSQTEAAIRTLKDSTGQYLWQPPIQAGSPATLLGIPVINPEGMPDIAANAFPIVVGDFDTGYRIRDRQGVAVKRLVERYAEYGQTGFLITKRTGGKVVLPQAFQTVKIAA